MEVLASLGLVPLVRPTVRLESRDQVGRALEDVIQAAASAASPTAQKSIKNLQTRVIGACRRQKPDFFVFIGTGRPLLGQK